MKHQHKVKNIVKLSTTYKFFKQEHPNIKLTKEEYKDICYSYNKEISKKILNESYEFPIPFRLGKLRIKKFKLDFQLNEDGTLKTTKLRPNWNATWELRYKKFPGLSRKEIIKELKDSKEKFLIYHYNDHTDGFAYRWYWDKQVCNIPNSSIFRFRPVKCNRLAIAPIIKNEDIKIDYFM